MASKGTSPYIYQSNNSSPVSKNLPPSRLAAVEKELQNWIEREIDCTFLSGKNFYENLESGQLLCRLMNKVAPTAIDISKVNEFQNLASSGNIKQAYIVGASHNINLFLGACKTVFSRNKTSCTLFTFEEIYLQTNTDAICSLLMNLKELTSLEDGQPLERKRSITFESNPQYSYASAAVSSSTNTPPTSILKTSSNQASPINTKLALPMQTLQQQPSEEEEETVQIFTNRRKKSVFRRSVIQPQLSPSSNGSSTPRLKQIDSHLYDLRSPTEDERKGRRQSVIRKLPVPEGIILEQHGWLQTMITLFTLPIILITVFFLQRRQKTE